MDLLLKSAGGTNRNCPPPAEPVCPVRYCVFLQKCSANVTAEHHMWSHAQFLLSSPAELDRRSQTFNLISALVADIHIFTFQQPCFSINVFVFFILAVFD